MHFNIHVLRMYSCLLLNNRHALAFMNLIEAHTHHPPSTFGQRAPLMVRLQSGHAQCDVPPALSPWRLSSSEAALDQSIIER